MTTLGFPALHGILSFFLLNHGGLACCRKTWLVFYVPVFLCCIGIVGLIGWGWYTRALEKICGDCLLTTISDRYIADIESGEFYDYGEDDII